MILVALIFFSIFLALAIALVSYIVIYSKAERVTVARTQALSLAESGIDKAAYELNQNPNYAGEVSTVVGNGVIDVGVTNIDATTKRVAVTAYTPDKVSPIATRIVIAKVSLNSDVVSFHYGVQAGNGGFTLANSSQIIGNVFSAGPISGVGNLVNGDAVSSGATGWIYGVHVTGNAYSHTIGKAGNASTVDKDAYYVTLTNTTVTGATHPGSADQTNAALPITDAQITDWENDALAGGVISNCDNQGDYTITTSVSLGPKKITCNLVVKGNSAVLNVTGPLWVTGNISFQTGPTTKMDAGLGGTNVAIIADNPANTTGSGIIDVGQTAVFQGSGAVGSFVFLISQNNSAETGGNTNAVSLAQGASALVAYASHGLISLSQSVNVKSVTAYKIALSQSASVTYDVGLPSTLFESGPGGSWSFVPGSYSIAR